MKVTNNYTILDFLKELRNDKPIKKENNMKEIVLLKDYAGLKEGTKIPYIKNERAYMYDLEEEEISDHSYKRNKQAVKFSKDFVEANMGSLFADPNAELKSADEVRLEKLKEEVEKLENKLYAGKESEPRDAR